MLRLEILLIVLNDLQFSCIGGGTSACSNRGKTKEIRQVRRYDDHLTKMIN